MVVSKNKAPRPQEEVAHQKQDAAPATNPNSGRHGYCRMSPCMSFWQMLVRVQEDFPYSTTHILSLYIRMACYMSISILIIAQRSRPDPSGPLYARRSYQHWMHIYPNLRMCGAMFP
jgi:hypothetical protein